MMSFTSIIHGPGPLEVLALLAAGGLVAFSFLVTYRLTLHPLAPVPGPLLAAATGWYERYFALVKDGGGRYWAEVERLHKIYGPIVRISPWEVHIKDPDWDDIYKLSSKASKPRWYYQSFGTTLSTNTTEAHQLHRARRQALVSWFSSQNIARNTPTVQATIDRLHDRLLASSGRVINMGDVFRSLAIDVASGFAFQRAFNNLDDAEFGRDFNHAVRDYGKTGIVNRHFFGLPFLLMRLLPVHIFNLISPKAGNDFMAIVNRCAKEAMNKPIRSHEEAEDVVQSILTADLPPEQKTFDRIFAEVRSIILGGTETTATVLTSITYHALSKPEIATRLRNELAEAEKAKGAKLEYQDIRRLPYLTAVIHEALRTCNAVIGRLTRSSEVADLQYQQYSLPRGTNISINLHDTHMNPTIFPEPEKFLPDRWLNESDYKRMSKYLQPWGRGSRLCLGMELAYTDLYLSVARLFGPDCAFTMRLYDTQLEDWDAYADYFAPLPVPGGKGLRVVVEPKEKAGKV